MHGHVFGQSDGWHTLAEHIPVGDHKEGSIGGEIGESIGDLGDGAEQWQVHTAKIKRGATGRMLVGRRVQGGDNWRGAILTH